MKEIAITQRLSDAIVKTAPDGRVLARETRESLDVNWALLFRRLGFLPVILPVNCDFRDYFRLFKINGLVLTGGNDLYSVSRARLSRKRDVFEKSLLRYALSKDLPVLGVCRGMQVVAEFFGAKPLKAEGHAGTRHKITSSGSSKYAGELGKIKEVNSYHNYVLKKAPSALAASAWSADGVIEALEHPKRRIFCQMWHSERERPFRAPELRLIRRVFE